MLRNMIFLSSVCGLSAGEVIAVTSAAVAGVVLIGSGLQGYLVGAGVLAANSVLAWILRLALIVAGLVLALPGGDLVGFTNAELNLIAAVVGLPAIGLTWLVNRSGSRKASSEPAADPTGAAT